MSTDRLIRAHRATNRWRKRLWVALSACFDGTWLGLLDHPRLARLDEVYYTDGQDVLNGRAFSYADPEYNLAGLYGWETAAIEAHFRPGSRVVVTGAGGGRELIALLQRGYDAVGYEPNPRLVSAGAALLRAREAENRLRACDRDAFPARTPRCDAVVVGWGSYTLIAGRARRIAFLRGARRALPAGAPILCSFLMRTDTRYFRIVAGTARVVRLLRRAERPELGDTVNENYVHCFTREEIESELTAGGFRVIAFSSEPYGHVVAVAV
ncbi:MAG: class I SAM-dependent methyltransferase [Actinomycetota bacterium]|nr:class I SAM-dependent methyltransferase [Actinomycetota bacterium]